MQAELSIEETNKLRIKLGLRPIPIPSKNTTIKDESEVVEEEDRSQIADTKGDKKKKKAVEDNLNNAVVKEGEIFTLKDVDILDEVDSDEQNELVAESEVLDSMMNNKRKARDSKHSMYDVSDDEQEKDTQDFKIDDAVVVKLKTSEAFKEKQRLKKLESEAARTGRQLVELESNDDEDENEDDYLVVGASDFSKKKKDKKKDKFFKKNKKGKLVKSNKTSNLLLVEDLDLSKHVKLEIDDIDNEKFDTDEVDLQKLTAFKTKKKPLTRENSNESQETNKRIKKNVFTSELFEGENNDNDERLIIGGNSEFLNNLKQSIFDKKLEQDKSKEDEEVTTSEHIPLKIDLKQSKKTEEIQEKEDDKPENHEDNFNNAGIGSMLQYLKKNSLLNITEKSKQESSARELQTKIRDQMGGSDINDMEEQAKIKILQEQYNPEINITYMDDENNELTRREAYKYMSHKFHGKKLSNKKQAKLIQKRN